MVYNLIKKGLKEPYKILPYIYRKSKFYYYRYVKGRIYFDYSTGVVGGLTGPAEYSCRLYEEVQLFKRPIRNYYAKRSLEIGCGYGRLTPWIADFSDAHYAVDPVSEFLNDARLLYPEVDFRQATAQSMPFPDDYFDLIVSWTVLQHIPPKKYSKPLRK